MKAANVPYQPYAYRPVLPELETFEERDVRLTAGFGAQRGMW
jgi:hypothetical protein